MKKLLEDSTQQSLRRSKIISNSEIVYQFGDLFVAEDTVTGVKRNLDISSFLNEDLKNARVLKG